MLHSLDEMPLRAVLGFLPPRDLCCALAACTALLRCEHASLWAELYRSSRAFVAPQRLASPGPKHALLHLAAVWQRCLRVDKRLRLTADLEDTWEQLPVARVIVTGSHQSGSSSLVDAFDELRTLRENSGQDLRVRYQLALDEQGQLVNVHLIDKRATTQGSLAVSLYQGRCCLCVCVDLSDLQSLEYAQQLLQYRESYLQGVPVVIAGTKADLVGPEQEEVVTAILQDLASRHGALYFTTSAATDVNIYNCLRTCVALAHANNERHPNTAFTLAMDIAARRLAVEGDESEDEADGEQRPSAGAITEWQA